MTDQIKKIEDIEREIIEEFEFFDDWADKYSHIIEMGEALPPLPESDKTEQNLVPGCQSRVWLVAEIQDGKIFFHADSDASITKGLIALLTRVLSGQPQNSVVTANLDFINQIGLGKHLSPTRANGFTGMIRKMKMLAARE